MPETRPPALFLAGPTCSGKSALAMVLAERFGGVVINADSMQVYRELRVLTARPSAADEALVPHALYGVRPAAEPGSAAWWREAALAEMRRAAAQGRLPILCGGTGLYFSALAEGLADIPDPGAAARAEARALLAEFGAAALHSRLAAADPATAARLRPSDGQRLARAWEVWRGTGRGLAAWLAAGAAAETGFAFSAIRLDPPRPDLRAAIAHRFAAMLAAGALEEARALRDLDLPPSLPAMRAHGVPDLLAFLDGEITLDEAERRATVATGQYTRRQATWFRHRFPIANEHLHMIHARFAHLQQFSERERDDLISFVHAVVDGAG